MAYFIYRERYIAEPVAVNSIVTFPTHVAASSTPSVYPLIPPYNKMTPEELEEAIPPTDIVYETDIEPFEVETYDFQNSNLEGAFDIYLPGSYLIYWHSSQMSGRSATGNFFVLKYYDYDTGKWIALSEHGATLKVSAAGAGATLLVTQERLGVHGKVTVALFNATDNTILMNRTQHLKAALMIYGFATLQGETIDELIERIEFLLLICCGNDREKLAAMKQMVQEIFEQDEQQNLRMNSLENNWQYLYDRFLAFSNPAYRLITSVTLPGYWLNYMRIGYVFHFSCQNFATNSFTITGASSTTPVKRYLFSVSEIPELAYLNSSILTGNVVYQAGSGATIYHIPIIADNTGLYLRFTRNDTFTAGSTALRFTFHVVIPDFPLPLP